MRHLHLSEGRERKNHGQSLESILRQPVQAVQQSAKVQYNL